MLLQVFMRPEGRPGDVLLREESDVDVVEVGSEQFFAYHEGRRGRQRLEITVEAGDSWDKLARRYGVSLGTLERINQRSRTTALHAGEKVVVYAANRPQRPPAAESPAPESGDDAAADDEPYADDAEPAPGSAPPAPSAPAHG
jgi:membrane-bound lytic murein transglycosylase D